MRNPVYSWVLSALRRYPLRSATLIGLSILTSLADGISISLLIPFLAVLFDGTGFAEAGSGRLAALLDWISNVAGRGNELIVLMVAIVAVVALRAALSFVSGLVEGRMSGQLSHEVRTKIHRNLLDVDFEYICVNDNGRLLNSLDTDTWRTTEAMTTVLSMFTNVSMIVVFSTILVLISWELTALVALMVCAISLLFRPFDARARAASDRLVKVNEELSAHSVQLFDAMRMIRAFGGEKKAQEGYEHASLRLFDLSLYMDVISGLAGAGREVLYALVFVVIIVVALYLQLEEASLIAYLALLHRVQPHIKGLDEARLHLASLSGSVAAVSELLELKPWAAETVDQAVRPSLQDAVRFEKVTFAYRGKDAEPRNAVEDITITLPIGKTTAIVGLSGAGKSTLTNLLFRFHDPLSGRLTVDGVPLTQVDLSWWRQHLTIAGQDADLINGTIRENIAYGLAEISEAEVVDAARQASAHAFISELPNGYDTRVGERGILLSAGQRQRIGLARALVRKSAILVLDEATNAIDSLTEAEVMASLDVLHGRTVIIIAHRLSTTRMADHIIVLARGRVVEAGTPAELYSADGMFAKMVKLQELSYVVGAQAQDGAPQL